jgi:hypothetical protein
MTSLALGSTPEANPILQELVVARYSLNGSLSDTCCTRFHFPPKQTKFPLVPTGST